ncbi:disintegrin and metalloproteinase domain-containing protein 10-like [Gigantopelta aegis]|uniref:disintegrin and metalloproteinase domain-containing protein 10-like n=1 Tax=Gigantopelta aegis TaxID=1735272 RepID=UPI001B88D6BC|nr:disintegrin and metalloproteinase domain-containing protein 10-like [Gigantopelta aegis]
MAQIASILINLVVLHSLPHCETAAGINWFGNKKHDIRATLFDQTYDTDIQFQNIIRTFNSTSYEKVLKFVARGSHFDIYLRKQPIFHNEMKIIHQGSSDAYVDIPVFYVGFNYDVSLAVVHGRFHNNNFKGRLNWNSLTVEIDCPNATDIDKNNHLKYVYSCKIKFYKTKDTNANNDYSFCKETHSNIIAKVLPQKWNNVKKNTYTQYHRHRRSLKMQRSCKVHLIADHLYFKYVGNMNIGSTVEAMSSSVGQADVIFRSTDFDGDGYGDNIGFVVGNITIYSDPHEPGYKLQDESLDAEPYLKAFSKYDFTSYCLGVAFTYRDFSGTVGLAWRAIANQRITSGGICEDREDGMSYNSLLVSQLNGGEFFPGYKSAFALTHEFGHSFGSDHDGINDPNCSPKSKRGKFIMHEFVISGNEPNNVLFSSCSIQNMNPVIVKKGFCLKTDRGPVCGNAIREDGEECDCGTSGTCRYVDPCCIPSDINNSVDIPCTFGHNKTKTCSPKHSPCCSEDCVPIRSSKRQICRPKTDCSHESYCDGVGSSCPASVNLPDGKPCNGERKICESGKCLTSICEWLKLNDCQCASKLLFCHVCCKEYNASEDECAPVGSFAVAPKYSTNVRIQMGHGCNGDKGYCDKTHVCIMDRLDDVLDIFASNTFQEDIDRWLEKHWFYVVGGFIIILVIVVIFVVTFKRHHDSHVEALRVAKLTIVLAETLRQKRIYLKKLESFRNKMERKIQQIMHGKRIDLTEAVGRLSLLFPTAPMPLLSETAKCSADEEAAVRILLIRGFCLQGFCVSVLDNPKPCFLQTEANETP